jgi:rhodanese-related sulfurtransferase/DNA-directed RNA polymerase subunit RPC12/RpoP
MKFLFLALILLSLMCTNSYAQVEYVCVPCGYSCDNTTHKEPGTCTVCNMALVEKSSIKFKNVEVEDFCKLISKNPNALILDVRSSEEFSGAVIDVPSFGHFKNAVNINVNELELRLNELAKYKNKEVLVYCSHSHRSPRASYLLGLKGFTNVKNMVGGVSTFADKKGDTCLNDTFVFHDK